MPDSVNTGRFGGRSTVFARRGVVSSGHYLASEIGVWTMRRGGNAFDAAAAMGFALALLKPHQNGIAGECPMLLRPAGGEVVALSGHGVAPAAATLDHFLSLDIDRIPGDGWLGAIVPPAVASWILLLDRFGTMRLADVLTPSIELAREGFAVSNALAAVIADHAERFRSEWPASADLYLTDGRPPRPGDLHRNSDWADAMQSLVDAESKHRDRAAGLAAARDCFYRGPIARRLVEYARTTPVRDASGRSHTALLTLEDFAAWQPGVEPPVAGDYHGWRVFKCGPWTQGPAMIASLNLLEPFDLAAMGHNSPDYIHTLVEAMKLAYADREFHYGDPAAGDLNLDRLLSKDYAAERRRLIDPAVASLLLRPGGCDPVTAHSILDVEAGGAWTCGGDTTKLEAIDAAGNAISVTVSGGWLMSSPVVPGLGFPLGTRGQMFSLVAGHPNAVGPGKRPRSTLTPTLATGPGGRCLSFGSPGGDAQDQWALQAFCNVLHFDMNLQQAVEAPTFWSEHWPISFYPRNCRPGGLIVEGRIDPATIAALSERGHRIKREGNWSGGNTLIAAGDPATGLLSAAASPRLEPAIALGF